MTPDEERPHLEDILLEMKNTSELMVDLAYSALLYDNEDIAQEVASLEEAVDEMNLAVQRAALEAHGKGALGMDHALAYIRLAQATEVIADSANMIADVILREVELHPIVRMSIQESEVNIARVRVDPGSALDGKSIGSAHVATDTGMWIIAIRRGRAWIYGPKEDTEVHAGDMLIARGPEDGQAALRDLARGPESADGEEGEETGEEDLES